MLEDDGLAENLRILKKYAEAGEARSQYLLGFNYRHGLDTLEDHQEAAKWFLKAANQGHADAQAQLGGMYREGMGVRQHHSEAVRWYAGMSRRSPEYETHSPFTGAGCC